MVKKKIISVLTSVAVIFTLFGFITPANTYAATTYKVFFPVKEGKIAYYQEYDPNYKGHDGVDIHASKDYTIYAAQSGTVVSTDNRCSHVSYGTTHNNQGFGETGNYIEIKGTDGIYYWYYHLKKDSLLVKKDDKVTVGQAIATMGSSGASTGTHLHFRMTKGSGYYSDAIIANPVGKYSGEVEYYYDPNPTIYKPGSISIDTYLKNNSTGTYAYMNGKDEKKTDIALGEKKSSDAFKMKFTPVNKNDTQKGVVIQPLAAKNCVVNSYSDNPVDGTDVNLWEKTSDSSQQWLMDKVDSGYVIRSCYNTNLVLTAVSGTVKVKTYSSGNKAQIWTLESIKQLSSIAVSSQPTKKEYYVGDKIDTSGMKVTAKYDDGTTKDVTSAVKVNASFTETGEKEVEVSYTEENVTKTAKFTVTVKEVTIPFKGKGTADDPYQIGSADDLVKLRETINDTSLNSKFAYAYYKQTADIDLKKQEWIPIGIGIKEGTSSNDYNRMFHGVYDGGNHYIHNLNVTGDFLAAGLFGFTDGKSKENQGVVRNLVVDGNVNVPGSVNSGGIVGQMMSGSVVENCGFIGDVTGGAYEGSTFNAAGGITGCLYEAGTIKNCYHTGNVTSKNCAAGIAGMIRFYKENSGLKANIENCYQANGKITSDSESGAITAKEMDMGTDNKSSVVNCFADSVCGANIKADKVDINTGMLVETSKIKKIAEDLGDAFANGTEKLNNGYPVLKWETNSSNSTLDLNADGELNATDALVLQRYLLGSAESGLKDTSAADMNKNGRIDIADLCMIKAELIK